MHSLNFNSLSELTCPDCHITYKYAAELLKHFAEHVERSEKSKYAKNAKKLPDLQPIKSFCKTETTLCDKNSDEVESPLKFCEVTMDEVKTNEAKTKTVERKYRCSYCSRCFGWSTDLKRHILTHTGEKPFECKFCSSKFTRNFLLQKHVLKQHVNDCNGGNTKSKVPPLKPIYSFLKQKSRKQDKLKIKRKMESGNFEIAQASLVCSNWYRVGIRFFSSLLQVITGGFITILNSFGDFSAIKKELIFLKFRVTIYLIC